MSERWMEEVKGKFEEMLNITSKCRYFDIIGKRNKGKNKKIFD